MDENVVIVENNPVRMLEPAEIFPVHTIAVPAPNQIKMCNETIHKCSFPRFLINIVI